MTDMLRVVETFIVVFWLWAIARQLHRIADALEKERKP